MHGCDQGPQNLLQPSCFCAQLQLILYCCIPPPFAIKLHAAKYRRFVSSQSTPSAIVVSLVMTTGFRLVCMVRILAPMPFLQMLPLQLVLMLWYRLLGMARLPAPNLLPVHPSQPCQVSLVDLSDLLTLSGLQHLVERLCATHCSWASP